MAEGKISCSAEEDEMSDEYSYVNNRRLLNGGEDEDGGWGKAFLKPPHTMPPSSR